METPVSFASPESIAIAAANAAAKASDGKIPTQLPVKRDRVEDCLTRRFFVVPSFEIHRGCKGLYDFGPPGCALKNNMLNFWRQHFVMNDKMLEIESGGLTPEVVLQTSGHVDKFTDLMVRDEVNKDQCYRADHLLKDLLSAKLKDDKLSSEARLALEEDLVRADVMDEVEMGAALKKYDARAPETNNPVSSPFPFNLMFQTLIGPTGKEVGYLRPETAQSIFCNFPRLLQANGDKIPFAAAQIGPAFRNEIAPRNGLLRVREFTLAEIEHFFREGEDKHPGFDSVADIVLNFLPRDVQTKKGVADAFVVCSLREAYEKKMITNQTLAYYLGRTAMYLISCSIKPQWMRFRQHLEKEMAHYARDCWDCELLTTHGWIECVGHADRAAYDLGRHGDKTGARMTAYQPFAQPTTVQYLECKPNKQKMGAVFKKAAQAVTAHLASLDDAAVRALQAKLAAGAVDVMIEGQLLQITPDLVSFAEATKKINGEMYVPHVVEPSFGVGRIFSAILEQTFDARATDEKRTFFRLSPLVAPVKVALLPVIVKPEYLNELKKIEAALNRSNISSKTDDSSAKLGRKYARADEIGTPFGVTVDADTLTTASVTVRERDSCRQVRVPLSALNGLLCDLCSLRRDWASVEAEFPVVEVKADDD